MECPVCSASAKYVSSPGFDGKSSHCPNCREYDVSRAVLERGLLSKLDLKQRRSARASAQSRAAQRAAGDHELHYVKRMQAA